MNTFASLGLAAGLLSMASAAAFGQQGDFYVHVHRDGDAMTVDRIGP
jgi:hypothetical protein